MSVMKTITPEQVELIDAVLAEPDVGLLTASILEKDIHVTDALQALMSAQFTQPVWFFAVAPACPRLTV